MKIPKLFFFTIIIFGCLGSMNGYSSVENDQLNTKIYLPAEKIALDDHGIWIQSGNDWTQVSGLAVDSNGIYIYNKDIAVGFWECDKCGNINPPWNFLACGRCGNPR